MASESDRPTLDNPIWSALTTRQAHFALGEGSARRYPPAMAPFLAIGEDRPEAVATLGQLAEPGEVFSMVGLVPSLASGWAVEKASAISQMVYQGRVGAPASDRDVCVLGTSDVPDMLELMAEVYPGYFRPRTIEMGTYLGVRHDSRLIAMAGQRLCFDGHREISGVATRPDFRGRGHAGRLIALLVEDILQDGLTPFLHVDADNAGARTAYEKAGFARRRDLKLLRLRREA